jgi:asparagine synthase (glutamine-hydrolysing)
VEERAREKGHFRSAISPERRALHLLRQADARADTTRGYEALCGVQKRDPLADARLVEFCLSLPEDQYLREGQARWLIRRAMAGRVPDEILSNCRRGFQASGWLGTLTAARTRIAAELDTMQKSALANSAIDIGRMRLLLEKLEYARPDRPGSLSEYRGVLELGLTVGRFVLWAESGA